MLFVGPRGAGKATRVNAFLRELYGPSVENIKIETRSVAPNLSNPSNTVDIQIATSNHHIALTPSDVGSKDRAVVMQLIKEVASHPPLGDHTFKVVVIDDAGTLSSYAQAALRRTMERYMKTCRIILTCDCISKIIPPLRSRCLGLRIAAPSLDEVQLVLQKVAALEKIKAPSELLRQIAEKSNRDLRRALNMLEATQVQAVTMGKVALLPQEAWDVAIEKVAKKDSY